MVAQARSQATQDYRDNGEEEKVEGESQTSSSQGCDRRGTDDSDEADEEPGRDHGVPTTAETQKRQKPEDPHPFAVDPEPPGIMGAELGPPI